MSFFGAGQQTVKYFQIGDRLLVDFDDDIPWDQTGLCRRFVKKWPN